MLRSEFNYRLPQALIAQQPAPARSASRLLQLAGDDHFIDCQMADFAGLLRPSDLLVFNDARVIPARLQGEKESGGKIELLVERLTGSRTALVQIRASKPLKPGNGLRFADGALTAVVVGREDEFYRVEFDCEDLTAALDRFGALPLPPYIERAPERRDLERYQTIFARAPGAVAAPTAGLHFDQDLLDRIAATGVETGFLTLQVGAGTFQPLRVDSIEQHRMHAERVSVGAGLVDQINSTRQRGGRVVAVGTTVVRSLETAAADGTVRTFEGETRLFITPGYRFKVVDALLTNFHLPESTLLMLVCAFGGIDRVLRAYRCAVERSYRFFSYGDAMFLERHAA